MRQEDNYWIRRLNSGRLSRRRFVGGAAAAGVGATGLALVGCGDDDDDDDKSPTAGPAGGASPTTAAGGSPTAAASAVVKGGVLRAQIPNVFDSVDVHRAFGDPSSWLSNYVLNKVVRFKNPDTGELEGDLAEKYEAPDPSTYIFTIRQDVKWNSPLTNGRAFTTADLKWHFERQAAGKTKDGADTPMRFGSFYKTITKIEDVDAKTLKLTLAGPNGSFLTRMAGYFSTVPNREAMEKFEADHRTLTEEAMPATGSYTLKKWRAGEPILFVKNATNFRKDEPNLDGWIAPLLFEDPAAYRTAFEQKQIDSGYSSPDASLTKSIIDANKERMHEVLTGVGNTVFLHLNTNTTFKNKPQLVQALNTVFDRRAMISTFHQNLGQVSGPVTWLQEGFALKPDDLIKEPGYGTDRAKAIADARKLWEAGGGPALGDIDIKIPDTWLANWPDTTQVIPKMLNDGLGVSQFKSTKTSYNEEIIPNLANGQWPNWFAWTSQVNSPDPRADLHANFNTKGSTNFQKVSNPDVDRLTDAAIAETDLVKAATLVRDLQKIMLANGQFGNVILYNYISRGAAWNYYHGVYKVNPSAGKAANGYNIFAGHLAGKLVYLDTKDPSFQGRPSASI
ncbi:MAG: ABC transporter substrate-binding protein [Tepidiformaceae bacterium]